MALQTFFHATSNFTYDTHVAPARSDDAVWDFIQSTHGYCVQFATSMTIMARTLGIPARVAVGFLPGEAGDDGRYVITGRESHAWPELYFQDYGWVRFEPTPAIQTGALPVWSDPFAGASGSDRPQDESRPRPVVGAHDRTRCRRPPELPPPLRIRAPRGCRSGSRWRSSCSSPPSL